MCSITLYEIADYYRRRYAKKALKYVQLVEMNMYEDVADAHESAEKVIKVLEKMTQR